MTVTTQCYKCDNCKFITTNFNEMLTHARKTKHQLTKRRQCRCNGCNELPPNNVNYCEFCYSGKCPSCGLDTRFAK